MNKKANTVLFVLGATVLNIVIMMAILLVLLFLFGRLLAPYLSQQINFPIVIVLFVASIVLTYVIYHRLIKLIASKIDMEKYFDPIFRSRKR